MLENGAGVAAKQAALWIKDPLAILADGAEGGTHRDALRWATAGSAACLGRAELGRIAQGAAADLALFKLDELRYAGHGDALAAIIRSGAPAADRVMVNGRWVVEDGSLPGLDVPALLRRHQTFARKMQDAV